MYNLTEDITLLKTYVDAMKRKLGLPSTTTMQEILSCIPSSGTASAYIVDDLSQMSNIDAVENDICFLFETTYVPSPSGTYSTEDNTFYMPKTVPVNYILPMPKIMNGYIELANMGKLSLISNDGIVYTFLFEDAENTWPNHSNVTVTYTYNSTLHTYERTSIVDTDTSESLDNTMDLLHVLSGAGSVWDNWTDAVTQFQLVPIGKRVTNMYKYTNNTWQAIPYGYTADAQYVSFFGDANGSLSTGSTFVGRSGYTTGSLDMPHKFDNVTALTFLGDKALGILNLLQYYVNTVSISGSTSSSNYGINTNGFPVKSDGTLAISTGSSLSSRFANNMKLYIIPKGVITSSVTNMYKAFSACKRISIIEYMDTSNVTAAEQCFFKNYYLETVPQFSTAKLSSASNMFNLCRVLSNDSLNNIMLSFTGNTKISSSNRTLKYLGLAEWQADICETLPAYTAFVNSGWSTGY